MSAAPRTAVVVPTLGQRPEFLGQSLASIRAAGEAYILIVAPASFDASPLLAQGLADEKIDEVGRSLPAAIEQGFAALPDSVEFMSWLGDDDVLSPGSLTTTSEFLAAHPRTSAVYGRCDYIDEKNRLVWSNKSGAWAAPLLRIGPDLIPQPGSLFRRSSYLKTAGLRTDLGWAFDLDIFLQLANVGKLSYVRRTLASFRWHADSLSVGQRRDSVREASQVRREYLPAWLRPISGLWERPVQWATYRAGDVVIREAKE
ncbi:MAG: glycosyltransferase family 2 protein [Actinobacteria bacterium]|nr:glycosyltransferase family 2 protein [Actinomycetota bacterium]